MTIRARLKLRYRLMVAGVMTIPALSIIWLHSSTPLNHTFRVTVITGAGVAVMLLFALAFNCPDCRSSLLAVSRQILFESEFCTCAHCGSNLDQSVRGRVGR
jgi:hypothetical protein